MADTELTFSRARWTMDQDGTWLALLIGREQAPVARRFADILPDKAHTATLRPQRKKRSLDANAYCWVLLGRLAEATGLAREELYRGLIREIGGNNEVICVTRAAEGRLREGWGHNGLGWVSEVLPSKLPGCVNVLLYYGSSTYDAKQMGRLIDLLVQECHQHDVETLTPLELSRLKEGWHA